MPSHTADDLSVMVMAGGAGTRFWPLSTEACPKQFLALLSERSLLQSTVDRIRALVPSERILVLTNQRFVDLTAEQLPELPAANIIGEPARRDTAAAVALGALLSEARHGAGVLAVLSADHHITPVSRFHEALQSAVTGARNERGALYTFGIVPTYPATGYGYLHRGAKVAGAGPPDHYHLRSFKEKPTLDAASAYLDSGEYYWNSGMFVWSLEAILGELQRQLPAHLAALRPAVALGSGAGFARALADAFDAIESTSIDFGVLEGARDVRCVEASFAWSDVGGWLALEAFLARDPFGNAASPGVHGLDASSNIVFAADVNEHIALVGVEDLIVVRAGNRTLVCSKDRAEAIKQLVDGLPPHLR